MSRTQADSKVSYFFNHTSPPCPQEYEQASKVDQFVTRFLLRETVNQLQALQSSLEGASDTLEAQARGQRYVRVLLACGLVCE